MSIPVVAEAEDNLSTNPLDAKRRGVETLIRYLPTPGLRFELSYTYFDLRFLPDFDATLPSHPFDEGYSPEHQVSLCSSVNLAPRLTLDSMVGYVDSLDGFDFYVRFDARIAYPLTDRLEISLTGLDLAEVHEELTGQAQFQGPKVPRSVFVMLT